MKMVLFGDPVLRKTAQPVTVFHKKLHSLIDSMAETLHGCEDGAALAANQVGILKRIIVVDYESEYLELINPEIIGSSGEQNGYEGCLSYPGYVGSVNRFTSVQIKYYDRYGKENIIEREGKLARCFQHEIDHLDGILFIDRMKENFLLHPETEMKISLESVLAIADRKSAKE